MIDFFKTRVLEPDVTNQPSIVEQLMAVTQDRKANPPARSYTNKRLDGGVDKIRAKIMEEAGEVVDAARETGDEGHRHVVYEAADVMYHLCVLLGLKDVAWSEVESELARRFGISGLDEKEARRE